MRAVKELGDCDIISDIDKTCSDIRGHGGNERTLCGWANPDCSGDSCLAATLPSRSNG
jgi:hypothetical protein